MEPREQEEEVWVLTGLEGAAELAGGGWPVGSVGASERGAPQERSPQSRARHRARWRLVGAAATRHQGGEG